MFKIGDRVKCIDISDHVCEDYELELGNTYIVSDIVPFNCLRLKNLTYSWHQCRFVLDIKCIRKQKIRRCLREVI